ncbi:MAG: recombinase family protein, partial [Schwartzia sp.]|nr:recombinase family protein [Schwartzia sp. (in: firmicutes)]
MKTIEKIERTKPVLPARKRVAAYARVSMESERMHHSLSAQISYYSNLIQKNPEWEYAGVYADYAISGTGTKRREEFTRMIADCDAGRIDIVLTKSIQRFARNTVDLLNTVRHLKDLGIEVRFEKENINSMSGDGELMLSILASFAQEESRSLSENVRWATVKRFQQGIPNGKFTIFGYIWEDDHLVIVPEEAEIIRWMYSEYMKGASR